MSVKSFIAQATGESEKFWLGQQKIEINAASRWRFRSRLHGFLPIAITDEAGALEYKKLLRHW